MFARVESIDFILKVAERKEELGMHVQIHAQKYSSYLLHLKPSKARRRCWHVHKYT